MTTQPQFLIYGAYGYTGNLVVRQAVARGLKPVLSGRDPARVQALAQQYGCQARPFSLDDESGARNALEGISAVLHCAGPFAHTAIPMVEACLRAGVHYLDITGEIQVFESLARRDADARSANIVILPGVGLDVVPSDCLAAHLKRRLPSADRLQIALLTRGGSSRGTARTAIQNLGSPSAVRREGKIVPIPAGSQSRLVDFGRGPTSVIAVGWGDVSTAYYTTGIPNIETYMKLPSVLVDLMGISRRLGGVLSSRLVRKTLELGLRTQPAGPNDDARAGGFGLFWGQVSDPDGGQATSRLRTPEGYTLTALTALAAVEKALQGLASPGFQTPARAFGPDFILEFPGCWREDLD